MFSDLGHQVLWRWDACSTIESPFTEEEIAIAITNICSGKSPSLDRYTPKFNKTLLLFAFAISSIHWQMEPTFRLHFLKPTSPLFPNHSLLKLETYIINWSWSENLCESYNQQTATCLTHPDQVGFVSEREAKGNTLKTILLMDYSRLHNIPLCHLSINVEKKFTCINWKFLKLSHEQIGLCPHMVSRIMSLYSSSARISQCLPYSNFYYI